MENMGDSMKKIELIVIFGDFTVNFKCPKFLGIMEIFTHKSKSTNVGKIIIKL